jgi:hypothetical protein
MFIRKIAPEFPDTILRHYIYDYLKEKDEKLVIKKEKRHFLKLYCIFLFFFIVCFYVKLLKYL